MDQTRAAEAGSADVERSQNWYVSGALPVGSGGVYLYAQSWLWILTLG